MQLPVENRQQAGMALAEAMLDLNEGRNTLVLDLSGKPLYSVAR